ncbi:CD40 ligand [Scomber scombrus]|uniref:CD40 ligand n=1 Tax=Scomber scombrus TaxID=13677 RepID=A0AAV1NZ08_SCOSC|nr:CD40 ligand [Scomber scombrus]
MINTYQTSLPAPPVPPRLNRSHPVFMPAPLPSQGNSKTLIRFLVGAVLLHLLLSVGGFIYLYHLHQMDKFHSAEGKAAFLSSEKQRTSYKPMARMIVQQKSELKSISGYLEWDIHHSDLRAINYYRNSWLTIMEPGDYYVFSRVTFSKGNSEIPLVSMVKKRENETGAEMTVMQAFCSLETHSGPRSCTATQGEVITLKKGNQLSVWVQDLSLVDYNEGATAFGMYRI